MSLPRVFISSSKEGLPLARDLGELLEDDAEAVVWTAGVFTVGKTPLEDLLEAVKTHDFAVLVLTSDDVTRSRGKQQASPRDNLVFELGLFMGVLGPLRTLMVHSAQSPPKLPSNVLGVMTATYKPDRVDGNWRAALDPAANRLREVFSSLGPRSRNASSGSASMGAPQVYWAAPHANSGRNNVNSRYLGDWGISVNMPHDLVLDRIRVRTEATAEMICSTCVAAIRNSDLMVVDLETYGLDSAWEIGFAEAQGIPVIGFCPHPESMLNPRTVHRKPFSDNFMHGWHANPHTPDLNVLREFCEGKRVCVCGPFANERAMKALRNSAVRRAAKDCAFPEDFVEHKGPSITGYPWRARHHVMKMTDEADVALVVLPRYGMDTSWQIGYAAAKGKKIIGWETADSGPDIKQCSLLDHWMHGWLEKVTVTSLPELAAVILGFAQAGLTASHPRPDLASGNVGGRRRT